MRQQTCFPQHRASWRTYVFFALSHGIRCLVFMMTHFPPRHHACAILPWCCPHGISFVHAEVRDALLGSQQCIVLVHIVLNLFLMEL
jgi:hypothetical protein